MTVSDTPVMIGGVGGSGTRLIANMLQELGYFLGDDLNKASDNLLYAFLFVRLDVFDVPIEEIGSRLEILKGSMLGRGFPPNEYEATLKKLAQIPVLHGPMARLEWLEERQRNALEASKISGREYSKWGWKEPNTHVLLDRLVNLMPSAKYIHVSRNGLEMSASKNQNQLKLWGKPLFRMEDIEPEPRNALAYWCHAQRRAFDIGSTMSGRFLSLNFDQLCKDPAPEIDKLLDFLGETPEPSMKSRLAGLIDPPESIGRFRKLDLQQFDPVDIEYVESLGFDTR